MVVTLNSALTSNCRGTYNPSMINFGKNELKNTTYLKEAPRTEVKHASKFARTAAKFMLGAMGLLSLNACSEGSENDIIPEPPTAKKTILERYTEQSNALGITNAGDGYVFDSSQTIDQDNITSSINVDHAKTKADTLYLNETDVNPDGSVLGTEKTKIYDKSGTMTYATEVYDNGKKVPSETEIGTTLLDKSKNPPVVTQSTPSIDLKLSKKTANVIDGKFYSKAGKLLDETTKTILKSTTRAIR